MKAMLFIIVFHMQQVLPFGPYDFEECRKAADAVVAQMGNDETVLAFCVPIPEKEEEEKEKVGTHS